MVHQDDARRVQNKSNAMLLARSGIPVFPSSGKVPLVKLYNRRDTEISPEDREAAIEKAREEGNKQLTVFVGATADPDIVKRMWRSPNQDAVPSIACGPARLVVIDADTKFNGPELIGKLFDEHGGVPEGCIVIVTQSGGRHYVFSDPDNAFTNSAGALKKEYGCDVRGRGGQFVAPGSIREDGKRYGDSKTLRAFVDAYTAGTIPPLPDYIVELIGTSSAEVGEDVPISKERDVIKQLDQAEVPEWEELCAPLGDYEFDKLQDENIEFKQLYNDPSDDCSDNRFKAARHVMREWPEMPPEHLAAFFLAWDGAGEFVDSKPRSGEYDNRQTAREWLKNQGLSKSSSGEAFGAVVDEDEDPEYEREIAEEKEAEQAPKTQTGALRFMSQVAVYGDPNWMVENICTRGMVGMLHGPSNAGKTFSAFHMAGCLSEGWQWFSRNVEQCGVVYCIGEGHAGINRRALAWAQRYEPKHDGFIFRDGIPNFALDPKAARRAIRKTIKEANAMLRSKGLPDCGLLFVDTFAKAVAGAEENSARDIQPILNMLRELAVELNICIIIVHHSGKDTSLGARGSSAIFGDMDFNLEIVSEAEAKKRKISIKAGHLAIIMPKMRDAGKSGRFEFRLEEVTLGKNKWGNPVTSMVVVEVDDKPSDGSAMGAVVDDEAPDTTDNLTGDQNRKDDDSRLKLCAKVVKTVQEVGRLVGRETHADAEKVREKLKPLRDVFDTSGPSNFSRAIRRELFGSEELPKRIVPESGGELWYVSKRGSAPLFVFKPSA